MLFLGIISWKGASRFNGGFVFHMGGLIFKWGMHPMGGGIDFDGGGGGSKKIIGCEEGGGWVGALPYAPPTIGNPGLWKT